MKFFQLEQRDDSYAKTGKLMNVLGRDPHDACRAALSHLSIQDAGARIKDTTVVMERTKFSWVVVGECPPSISNVQDALEMITDSCIRNYDGLQEFRKAQNSEEWYCEKCKEVMPFSEVKKGDGFFTGSRTCINCKGRAVLYKDALLEQTRAELFTLKNTVGKDRRERELDSEEIGLLRDIAKAASTREYNQCAYDAKQEPEITSTDIKKVVDSRMAVVNFVDMLRTFYGSFMREGAPKL